MRTDVLKAVGGKVLGRDSQELVRLAATVALGRLHVLVVDSGGFGVASVRLSLGRVCSSPRLATREHEQGVRVLRRDLDASPDVLDKDSDVAVALERLEDPICVSHGGVLGLRVRVPDRMAWD